MHQPPRRISNGKCPSAERRTARAIAFRTGRRNVVTWRLDRLRLAPFERLGRNRTLVCEGSTLFLARSLAIDDNGFTVGRITGVRRRALSRQF